jgi:hypothetical protein
MLRISHETTKKTLLQYLTAEAGKQGDLVLCIDYLPSFLDTYISFRVFAFQISNYPRNILWFSTNNHILLFLQQSGAPIFVPMEQNLLNYNQTAPQDLRDKDSFTAQDIQEFNFPNFSALSKIPHTPSSITAKELIQEKSSYTRSSLLEENEPTKKLASPDPVNISNIQNFDTWIEKIAATKEALNTIKDSSSSFTYKKAPKKWSNLSLVRNFSLVAVFLGVAGFLIFALFPTKALTIEIQSLSKDKQAEIEVSPSQFRSKNISFKNEKTVNTSDFLEEKVKYATGKVSLVNLSGNSIDLDNGSFKVVKDGKEYKANFNSSYPKTFTIPGKGSLNDFQVQSTKDGDGFNLSEGTKLDITNLSGAGFRVCSNCFALFTS